MNWETRPWPVSGPSQRRRPQFTVAPLDPTAGPYSTGPTSVRWLLDSIVLFTVIRWGLAAAGRVAGVHSQPWRRSTGRSLASSVAMLLSRGRPLTVPKLILLLELASVSSAYAPPFPPSYPFLSFFGLHPVTTIPCRYPLVEV